MQCSFGAVPAKRATSAHSLESGKLKPLLGSYPSLDQDPNNPSSDGWLGVNERVVSDASSLLMKRVDRIV